MMIYRLMYENYNPTEKMYTHWPPVRVRDLVIENEPSDPQNILYMLEHHLTFATDEEINRLIYQEYHNQYGIYNSPLEMLEELRAQIAMNGDYWEKLYETTKFEYNPINNYDMAESEEDCRCGESEAQSTQTDSANGTTTGRQYGYNESSATNTTQEVSQSGSTTGNSGRERSRNREARTLTRSGNIGVTTTQQMIEQERNIIISVLRKYVESFRPFFMIL